MSRLAPEHYVMHGLSRWATVTSVVFHKSCPLLPENVVPRVVPVSESNPEEDAVSFGYDFVPNEWRYRAVHASEG